MIVLKTVDRKGVEEFWELVRCSVPDFDDQRREWVLVSTPIGARPRHTELRWLIRSPDLLFVWVREFNFDAVAQASN